MGWLRVNGLQLYVVDRKHRSCALVHSTSQSAAGGVDMKSLEAAGFVSLVPRCCGACFALPLQASAQRPPVLPSNGLQRAGEGSDKDSGARECVGAGTVFRRREAVSTRYCLWLAACLAATPRAVPLVTCSPCCATAALQGRGGAAPHDADLHPDAGGTRAPGARRHGACHSSAVVAAVAREAACCAEAEVPPRSCTGVTLLGLALGRIHSFCIVHRA